MKTKQLILSILFLLMLWQMKGQSSCASAVNLTITPGQSTGWLNTNADYYWYKFTASGARMSFDIKTKINYNRQLNYVLEFKDCSNNAVGADIFRKNDSTITVDFFTLTPSQVYYLKLNFYTKSPCTGCTTSSVAYYSISNLNVTAYTPCTLSQGYICSGTPSCEYVCNGNFEQNNGNPVYFSEIGKACGWDNADYGTTADYYTTGGTANFGVPCNILGNEAERTGLNAYVGFVSYSGNSGLTTYRESITTRLKAPLTANETYYISFYLSMADLSYWRNNDNIGFVFHDNTYSPGQGSIQGATILSSINYVNTSSVTKSGWTKFTVSYVATGLEEYLTIGALMPASSISIEPGSPSNCNGSYSLAGLPDSPSAGLCYYYMDDISVASICCTTPSMTLTGNISNYGITNFGSGLFQVNGTLIINSTNVTFTNSQLQMAPNAKILVAPACTLNLASAHLFSCTNMWEGIELQNGSQLYSTRNGILGAYTTIDDARIAVYVNASGITAPNIILNYTTLSKNAVGVKIENYAGGASATYPISMGALTIQGNVATAYSPGTTLKPYLLSGTPVNYPTTIYGFQLNSVSRIQIGSTTGLYNYLQNLQIGVRGLKSNVLVHRCTFQDLTSSLDNRGIWMSGDYANSITATYPQLTFGTKYRLTAGSSGNSNNFKNLKRGIFLDSCMTSYINYNTFNDIANMGIVIYRSNFFWGVKQQQNSQYYVLYDRDTSLISYNTMTPLPAGNNVIQMGIGLYENYYLSHIASSNTITLKPASGWSTGIDIYHGANNYNSSYIESGNIINGSGNYGICTVNDASEVNTILSLRSINNNTITVGTGYCTGFYDNPNVGIYNINSPYAVIKENIIDETSLGAAPSCMIGVYAYNDTQDNISCNLMKNTDISTAVAFNNLNSTYRGNVMNGAIAGLYLVNGTMGNLGTSTSDAGQNEWINNSFSTYTGVNGIGSNIYWDSGTNRWPNNNVNAGIVAFTNVPATLGTLGCTQYHKGGNNSDLQPKDDNNDKATDVINGAIAFGQYQDGMLWEHRNGVLSLLKDSLLDNAKPLFKQFRNQQTNTNLGKINTLMRGLGDYAGIIQNKNAYLQQLNSIATTTNVIESNYKMFMNEYINNIVGVAAVGKSTYSNIQALAQKCPFTDGAVVFNARALMKIWGNDQVYSNVCETIVLPDTKLVGKFAQTMEPAQENVLVYPNPNNGTFSIAYTFEQSGQVFALYDLMGREIIRTSLEKNAGIKEISNSDLNNGVYFYKITHGNNILFNGKLIINK